MPRKDAAQWPTAPRVAGPLEPPPAPLGEGVSWSGVDAGPDDSFGGTVADYEFLASRLHGVRFTGTVFEAGRWSDVVVQDCELSGATLDDAVLVRVVFQGCRMSGLIATGLEAHDVRFVDCKVDGANFRGSALERCVFEDCDMADADFYGAAMRLGAMRRCSLARAEFSKAKCDGLDLRGSDVLGIRGASSLAGCVITSDQMVPLGLALLATIDAKVVDEPTA